jgi:hypothetical protein
MRIPSLDRAYTLTRIPSLEQRGKLAYFTIAPDRAKFVRSVLDGQTGGVGYLSF